MASEREPPAVSGVEPLGLWRRMGRGVTLAWRATGRGVIEFYYSNNLTYASSIAYYSLLSFSPFMLMVVTIISRMAVGRAGNEKVLIDMVERALPRNFDFLSAQIVQLQRASVGLTIASAVVTIWASMGVFSALTAAVDHAWSTEQPRTYFRHQLTAFVMMATSFLVFALALLVVSAAQVSGTSGFASAQRWVPGLQQFAGLAAEYSLLPTVIVAMGLIFYYAPNTKTRLRDVWFGAALAGVLWRVALAGFSWYLRDVSRFSLHGSLGTVVAFLVWVYLSAVILLYGVEVTACYARARKELAEQNRRR